MNVAVLLSGGVDSAVVVHRLKEQGIDPTLFYIRIGMDNDEGDCSAEEDIEMCIILRVSTDFRLKSYLSIGNIGTMSWNMLCER